MGRKGNTCKVLAGGNVKENNHVEDLGVDSRMLLKWILNNIGGRGLDWSRSAWG
jgi:hypothetical protein